MKAKKIMAMLTAVSCASLVFPVFANAESLDALDKKESALLEQGEQISADIQLALTDINATYAEVNELKETIAKNEEQIDLTKQEIEETQETIEQRKEVMADRMKEMQLNNASTNSWEALLSAESFSDFVGRAYAMTVIQKNEKEKVVNLNEETEKLAQLEAELEETQQELLDNQATLEADASKLDKKIESLKGDLSDNEATLNQVAESKAVEEARIKAEEEAAQKAKEEAESQAKLAAQQQAQAAADSAASSSSSSQSSSQGTTGTTTEESSNTDNTQPDESTDSGSGGNTLTMQSTAYSMAQPGLSYYTATGIDLRQNPMVIAVDPSVIPLGSIVEVSGYGVAIAGDTGSAISGNIIDVHFSTVAECTAWGRRQVTVTIY